jgi:hypothetical protein
MEQLTKNRKNSPKIGRNFDAASKKSFDGIWFPSMNEAAFQARITSGKKGVAMKCAFEGQPLGSSHPARPVKQNLKICAGSLSLLLMKMKLVCVKYVIANLPPTVTATRYSEYRGRELVT